jgi:hypothetical protein
MIESRPRRFGGPHVVRIFLAILAIAIAAALYSFFLLSDPRGEILALRAEGERSALVLRKTTGKRGHVHLVRVLEDGSQPHKISLFGVQQGAVPFVVGDRVIVEAMTARGFPTIEAFDVRDLGFAYWGPEPSKTLEDGARGATRATQLDGRPVLVSAHRGQPGELLVFDARSGEELLRRPLERVIAPVGLVLLEDGGARIAIEGGGSVDLDLRDGSVRSSGMPVVHHPRCRVEDGRLLDGERDLGSLDRGSSDAVLDVEGGCLVRRGMRLELHTGTSIREAEIVGGRVGPSAPAHVDGSTLFLVVDGDEVAVLDLEALRVRGDDRRLSIREVSERGPSHP